MEGKSIEKMELSGRSLKELWIAAKWAKLLALITIGVYSILVLLSIFTGLQIAIFVKMMPFGGFFLTLIEIALYTIVILIPGILLFNFASKIQTGIQNDDEESTTIALKRLRVLFQFFGILAIVVIALIGISIVFSVINSII